MHRLPDLALASLTAALLLLFTGRPLAAEPPGSLNPADTGKAYVKPEKSKFLRVERNSEDDPISLQTAIARYVPVEGDGDLVVDLIGAVHIADRSYYNTLNKQFDQYDVVLYELVAPKGTRIPKGGRQDSDNPLAMIQQMAKMVLRLESQTEAIDYTKENFVHADLSPEEIAETIQERGEDGMTLFLGITADLLRQYNRTQQLGEPTARPERHVEDLDPFSLLLDPAGSVKLKRMMSEQFDAMDSPDAGLGQTIGRILVEDRNKAAMRVFGTELAKGKKRIAIFYGAAHLPDFEQRLMTEFGLKRDRKHWLTAWDMRIKDEGIQDLFELP